MAAYLEASEAGYPLQQMKKQVYGVDSYLIMLDIVTGVMELFMMGFR